MKKTLLIALFTAIFAISVLATSVSITFGWTANLPSENVTKYVIYKNSGTNFIPCYTSYGTNNTCVVTITATKLDPQYSFKIAAVNDVGSSPLSTSITWVNTLPQNPTILPPLTPGSFYIRTVVTNTP